MTTFRRIVCLATVVAGVSFTASAKTCTWINTTTATAQDWREPTNWQDGQVPAAGDDVVIADSTYINLGGAEIGTLTHTAGALTISTGSLTWTNRGDIVTKGSGFDMVHTTNLYLPEGEHMISNTCTMTYMRDPNKSKTGVTISGPGILRKMGRGAFKPNSANVGEGNAHFYYKATGAVKILEGTFWTSPQELLSGPTEITVSGIWAVLYLNKNSEASLNADTVVKIAGGARVQGRAANVTPIKELYFDGAQCCVGTWGAWNASTQYKSPDIATVILDVKEGPGEGGYTGLGDSLWSGRTRTFIYTGTTAKNSWESPSYWKDGLPARTLDDIVVDATVNFRYVPDSGFTWHDLTLSNNVEFGHSSLATTGDIHLNGHTLTFDWENEGLNLRKGSHVIDGGGSVLFEGTKNQQGLQGSGDLVLRDSVTLTYKGSSNNMPLSGGITVENGSFVWDSSKSLSACTNITVTGAGSTFWMKQGSINPGICVAVEKGGKVKLANAVSNDIAHLHLGGRDRSPRTYGSSASSADRKLDAYFDKTTAGMFRVTDGPVPGLLLLVR